MSVTITSPVTGSAQTGLTLPTYTLVADTLAQNVPGKQYAITALGGTQSGVDVNSASKPFTVTVLKPANIRLAPTPNPVTGAIGNSPRNVYSVITRKGVLPLTGQNPQVMVIRTDLPVVAGSDLADPEDVRAALSLHIGVLSQISAGLGDTAVSGTL